MFTSLTNLLHGFILPKLATTFWGIYPLLARGKSSEAPTVKGPSYSVSWAIVLFCIVLGLMVSLRPPHRATDFKHPKDE